MLMNNPNDINTDESDDEPPLLMNETETFFNQSEDEDDSASLEAPSLVVSNIESMQSSEQELPSNQTSPLESRTPIPASSPGCVESNQPPTDQPVNHQPHNDVANQPAAPLSVTHDGAALPRNQNMPRLSNPATLVSYPSSSAMAKVFGTSSITASDARSQTPLARPTSARFQSPPSMPVLPPNANQLLKAEPLTPNPVTGSIFPNVQPSQSSSRNAPLLSPHAPPTLHLSNGSNSSLTESVRDNLPANGRPQIVSPAALKTHSPSSAPILNDSRTPNNESPPVLAPTVARQSAPNLPATSSSSNSAKPTVTRLKFVPNQITQVMIPVNSKVVLQGNNGRYYHRLLDNTNPNQAAPPSVKLEADAPIFQHSQKLASSSTPSASINQHQQQQKPQQQQPPFTHSIMGTSRPPIRPSMMGLPLKFLKTPLSANPPSSLFSSPVKPNGNKVSYQLGQVFTRQPANTPTSRKADLQTMNGVNGSSSKNGQKLVMIQAKPASFRSPTSMLPPKSTTPINTSITLRKTNNEEITPSPPVDKERKMLKATSQTPPVNANGSTLNRVDEPCFSKASPLAQPQKTPLLQPSTSCSLTPNSNFASPAGVRDATPNRVCEPSSSNASSVADTNKVPVLEPLKLCSLEPSSEVKSNLIMTEKQPPTPTVVTKPEVTPVFVKAGTKKLSSSLDTTPNGSTKAQKPENLSNDKVPAGSSTTHKTVGKTSSVPCQKSGATPIMFTNSPKTAAPSFSKPSVPATSPANKKVEAPISKLANCQESAAPSSSSLLKPSDNAKTPTIKKAEPLSFKSPVTPLSKPSVPATSPANEKNEAPVTKPGNAQKPAASSSSSSSSLKPSDNAKTSTVKKAEPFSSKPAVTPSLEPSVPARSPANKKAAALSSSSPLKPSDDAETPTVEKAEPLISKPVSTSSSKPSVPPTSPANKKVEAPTTKPANFQNSPAVLSSSSPLKPSESSQTPTIKPTVSTPSSKPCGAGKTPAKISESAKTPEDKKVEASNRKQESKKRVYKNHHLPTKKRRSNESIESNVSKLENEEKWLVKREVTIDLTEEQRAQKWKKFEKEREEQIALARKNRKRGPKKKRNYIGPRFQFDFNKVVKFEVEEQQDRKKKGKPVRKKLKMMVKSILESEVQEEMIKKSEILLSPAREQPTEVIGEVVEDVVDDGPIDDNAYKCVVCELPVIRNVTFNCSHLCCMECYEKKIKKCPRCQIEITKLIHLESMENEAQKWVALVKNEKTSNELEKHIDPTKAAETGEENDGNGIENMEENSVLETEGGSKNTETSKRPAKYNLTKAEKRKLKTMRWGKYFLNKGALEGSILERYSRLGQPVVLRPINTVPGYRPKKFKLIIAHGHKCRMGHLIEHVKNYYATMMDTKKFTPDVVIHPVRFSKNASDITFRGDKQGPAYTGKNYRNAFCIEVEEYLMQFDPVWTLDAWRVHGQLKHDETINLAYTLTVKPIEQQK